jgi:hypothetical protein
MIFYKKTYYFLNLDCYQANKLPERPLDRSFTSLYDDQRATSGSDKLVADYYIECLLFSFYRWATGGLKGPLATITGVRSRFEKRRMNER